MNLQHLCSAPHVTVYFDSWNNWLYIEWEGALTLPAVQYACLEVAQCFVQHAYPRVINNDSQITSLPLETASWLGKHFFPYLKQAGIEQLAWVHGCTVRGFGHASQVLQQLPHLEVGLFSDMEEATRWLAQTNPAYAGGHLQLPRPVAEEMLLSQTVAHFKQALEDIGVNAEAAAYA